MQWAGALPRDLSARNQQIAIASGSVHELTAGEMPSVIFRTQRKPATWKFPSCFLPQHLRKPRMGAPSDQGPYRLAKSAAHGALAMDGRSRNQSSAF